MSDKLYSEMPMIALRGLVIFPSVQLHFDVGRPKSLAAINEAMSRDRLVFLAAQKELEDEDPSPEGIYEVGCVTRIKQIIRIVCFRFYPLLRGQVNRESIVFEWRANPVTTKMLFSVFCRK